MATPGGGSRSLLLRPEAPALNDPARDEAFDDEEEAEDPAEAFVGLWQNVRTDNLEEYLKHIGIGWAKRKLAVGFKPVGSWGIVDGVLQLVVVEVLAGFFAGRVALDVF